MIEERFLNLAFFGYSLLLKAFGLYKKSCAGEKQISLFSAYGEKLTCATEKEVRKWDRAEQFFSIGRKLYKLRKERRAKCI